VGKAQRLAESRAEAMSQKNVELLRKGIDAWNRREAELWLDYAAPEIEWMPAGPASVERAVYRGYEEVAAGFASTWDTWDLFEFEESEMRDLGDSVLWLGRVKMRGSASHVELDQEFAAHALVRDGKIIRMLTFLSWQEAFEAVGPAG
jgi:ketosteroid isomerase-like protein